MKHHLTLALVAPTLLVIALAGCNESGTNQSDSGTNELSLPNHAR